MRYFANSEYRPLKAVLLCRLPLESNNVNNAQDVLYSKNIDCAKLKKEYQQIVDTYRKLGIKAFFVDSEKIKNTDVRYVYNLMFTRDLFFMTPQGAIIARMFSDIRKDEVKYAGRTLRRVKVRIRKYIGNDATFEGADALWVNDGLVAVGVGNRTNAQGFQQVKEELKHEKIRCVCLPAPQDTLHLLGALQFVDSGLVLARIDLIDSQIINFLKENKIRIIPVPENAEIRRKHAMNFVILGPRKIIMPAGCPKTRKIYERAGLKISAEIRLTQLVNGGGGLACATGILAREQD